MKVLLLLFPNLKSEGVFSETEIELDLIYLSSCAAEASNTVHSRNTILCMLICSGPSCIGLYTGLILIALA